MRSFLLFVCLAVSASVFAQGKTKQDSLFHVRTYTTQLPVTFRPLSISVIPRDQYAKNIGFFCKQELKMQQAHIPVSFRLGSMDYVNRMEQKPGYR